MTGAEIGLGAVDLGASSPTRTKAFARSLHFIGWGFDVEQVKTVHPGTAELLTAGDPTGSVNRVKPPRPISVHQIGAVDTVSSRDAERVEQAFRTS